jgi:Domain of unknown function (DUF4430)
VIRRAAAALTLLAVAVGCGSGTGGGRATLWITRDRGEQVLKTARVPAGLTAIQALERVADVSTRYDGRYVQAIDSLRGSLTAQHDWFYFVNGYEADRSAAEYRLHAGDVEWWDFRAWRHAMHVPVVVGAFPEPFLHGWNGDKRPTVVEYDKGTHRHAVAVARRLHARVAPVGSDVGAEANVLVLECPAYPGTPRITARMRSGDRVGDPVVFTVICVPNFERRARFRYQVIS